MTANALGIRPGMDVFDAYQDRYIGSVVSVLRAPAGAASGRSGNSTPTGGESGAASATLVQELGATVQTASPEHTGRHTLGEEIGPVPTIAMGNSGPILQSAGDGYATHANPSARGVTHLVVRPGRLNLGFLSPVIYIPIEAVLSFSMERVLVETGDASSPSTWKGYPRP